MIKRFKTIILLVGISVITLGFQNCSSVKTIEKTQLEGRWQLKSLKGENAHDAFKTPIPDIRFNSTENIIFGTGGCNNYNSVYTLTNNNEFTARGPVSTMRACIAENKEPQFFAALSTPNMKLSLTNEGNTLLFTKGNDIILEFEKAPEGIDSKSLTGSWVLTNISGGDINTLFHKKPTLKITENGEITGNGGCNNIRTKYSLNGDKISFQPVTSTRMACPSLQGENLFTSHLSNTLQMAIDNNKLSLFNEGELVLEFTKDTTGE